MEHSRNSAVQKLPNLLTLARILAVPVFVVLLMEPGPRRCLWAAGIFIVASLTDWLDGYIARAYKAESILGTLLDPLADKIIVMAALVMLCSIPQDPRVPPWLVVLLLTREMIVSGLRALAALKGVLVPASRWAKHKTAWTMVAIVFLLIREPYKILSLPINFHNLGMICLYIALVFSIVTGTKYATDLKNLFREA